MQPLIDSDVLRYEIGFASEVAWQQPGYPPFDFVADMLDERINNICAVVGATQPPKLYLTGKGNFRNEIAKRVPYKSRKSNKPWHFNNITAYLLCKYDVTVSLGMEADDLMSIEQMSRPGETIICTRDKDLRQVPGMQYGWELGNQPSFGPLLVEGFGEAKLSSDRKKINGYGEKFFWAQCLTGDPVDSIPGIPKMGAVGAAEILDGVSCTEEAFKAVLEAYKDYFGDNAEAELLEQGRLLYMTRKLNEDGTPVLWELPNGVLHV
jgi:hypothetical protein